MMVFHEGWAAAVALPVDFLVTVFFVVDAFEVLVLGACATGEDAVLEDMLKGRADGWVVQACVAGAELGIRHGPLAFIEFLVDPVASFAAVHNFQRVLSHMTRHPK
jgi:hypothetical protein